jgi:hypothetical protein
MDHTLGTIKFIYTISLLTDTHLLVVICFWLKSHFVRIFFACQYGESYMYFCCTPRLDEECLLCSIVGILNVAQKEWTLPLILNLIGGCNFE